MSKTILTLCALAALAGCTQAQVDTAKADNAKVIAVAQKAVVAGQLFCAKATQDGPLIVALADALGAPVIATGAAASVVAADCAVIGAIPVAPPAVPAAAPVVAAAVPVIASK